MINILNKLLDNDFNLCPALKIGPYCATFCNQYFSDNCEFVSMCNQHGCFCTQGHTGDRCGNRKYNIVYLYKVMSK